MMRKILGVLIILASCAALLVAQSSYNFATANITNLNGGGNAFFLVAGPATSQKTYTFENASRSIPSIITSGTSALGTSEIAAGACASAVTTAATGTAATDWVITNFGANPTATTGYTAGAMLTIVPYPSTNNVNFVVCNNSPDPITPSALTLHWLVVRTP